MNTREKRQKLAKAFGTTDEKAVSSTCRYKVLFDLVCKKANGLCERQDCHMPLSSISFFKDLVRDDLCDSSNWIGLCRRHKQSTLIGSGVSPVVESSCGFALPSFASKKSSHIGKHLEEEFFHNHKKGDASARVQKVL